MGCETHIPQLVIRISLHHPGRVYIYIYILALEIGNAIRHFIWHSFWHSIRFNLYPTYSNYNILTFYPT